MIAAAPAVAGVPDSHKGGFDFGRISTRGRLLYLGCLRLSISWVVLLGIAKALVRGF